MRENEENKMNTANNESEVKNDSNIENTHAASVEPTTAPRNIPSFRDICNQ